jgi:hypothetical protein
MCIGFCHCPGRVDLGEDAVDVGMDEAVMIVHDMVLEDCPDDYVKLPTDVPGEVGHVHSDRISSRRYPVRAPLNGWRFLNMGWPTQYGMANGEFGRVLVNLYRGGARQLNLQLILNSRWLDERVPSLLPPLPPGAEAC